MLYKLYIGSNNTTHRLEKTKAMTTALKYFPAFTSYEVVGHWAGQQEKTLVLEIETKSKSKIKNLAIDLAKILQQQAIGIVKTQESMQFIN